VPPLIFTLCAFVFALVSDGLAMTKPLASIEGFYDLHLFPERDRFDYRVSETHRACQFLHVTAFVVLFGAFVVSVVNVFYASLGYDGDRISKRMTMLCATFAGLAAACHFSGIATLVKVLIDYKHIADDLPVTPKLQVEIGTIMDALGCCSSIFAFVLVLWTVVASDRQGHVRLL